METQNQQDSIFVFSFDSASREYLKKITLWAKICALCAFAGYVIALVDAFFMKKTVTTSYIESGDGLTTTTKLSTGSTILGTIIVVIIGCVINYFLLRFSTMTRTGIDSMNQLPVNQGMGNLRNYFKTIGILLLIVLIIMALIFLAVIISAALGKR